MYKTEYFKAFVKLSKNGLYESLKNIGLICHEFELHIFLTRCTVPN